ncbi:UCH-domain-containing protein [Rickenella mellea]|uniref:ubiquitinyl hydrolase 1 n=1 Tax=Rickenella mellea TaxID=50990 RepID=A0A4Y7Q835_9AGAM|nr:UCH-domain-containing protein [Rickenella mellea]
MENSLPSPADSPAPTPLDSSPPSNIIPSRKRARSSTSDTSSSKRALSEDPSLASEVQDDLRSPRQAVQHIPQHHTDIDTYMADQGEADIARQTIPLPPPPTQSSSPFANMLSPAEQYSVIGQLRKVPMKAGDTWYLISRQWFRRWEKVCTGEIDKEGAVSQSELGPVNNANLVNTNGELAAPSLIEGVDVEFVSISAWKLFEQWYGEPVHTISRKVINRGVSKEASLELHPPKLHVLRLTHNPLSTTVDDSEKGLSITLSCKDPISAIYRIVREALRITVTEIRIWKVDGQNLDGISFPSGRLLRGGGDLVPPASDTRTTEQALIESGDGLVVEVKNSPDDDWIVDASQVRSISAGTSTPSALEEQPPPLFASGSDFFSRMTPASSNSVAKSSSNSNGAPSSSLLSTSTLRSTVVPFVSYALGKLKVERKSHLPGTIGLVNMGNTCFMNSALQCLAHTQELMEYFLTGVYKEELNTDNPLGMGGAIAEAFGALLHRLWSPDSPSSSYSPREFKLQLQRFAPQFSGYQQHDSQELVAFLLDGLHEDLNRVLKKPYVEKPDWEGGGDKELVQLAKTSWEGYMKRNDSVIVDLFQGQYRSTLVCPECQKVSITFDPFMYLTLPLPVQKKWRHNIFYVPWDLDKPHVKVPIEVGRNASFKDLRQLLGRWMDTEPDNLLTLEVFSNRFYKNLDDTVLVGEMNNNDVIVCFELPCHGQQSRTWKPNPDPNLNPVIVPVHLCKEAYSQRPTFGRAASGFAQPFVVVLSPAQLQDKKQIYDAVVERLQRWSIQPHDLYQWEGDVVMEEVPIAGPSSVSITEIKENGDIVTMQEEAVPEEGDIADEKSTIMQDVDNGEIINGDLSLKKLGPKPELFQMHYQSGHENLGTGNVYSNVSQRWDRWEEREAQGGPLLRDGDALFCEWDDNLRTFYFGDDRGISHSRWDTSQWEEFIHPEYKEAIAASSAKKNKGISLQDCLDEFTKEEQLGEDDLWYCPSCKKHQQASKKFDLWKLPDILVVHLKRFSNSRALRDKIDALIDFPIDGLDLEPLVGERETARRLAAEGVDVDKLGLTDLDESLVYDLYGVDEHMGGLGGGHYRAYVKHHETGKWYHFDDSYVTPVQANEAVNANAYLLFYKRRTNRPIGGKTHDKVQAARERPPVDERVEIPQLPTPPDEPRTRSTALAPHHGFSKNLSVSHLLPTSVEEGSTPDTLANTSPASSPPPLDDGDPPLFEDAGFDELLDHSLDLNDPRVRPSRRFDFPDPSMMRTSSMQNSPTSSNEAEPDTDEPEAADRPLEQITFGRRSIDHNYDVGYDWAFNTTRMNGYTSNPFDDSNVEGKLAKGSPVKEIPVEQSTLLDIDL